MNHFVYAFVTRSLGLLAIALVIAAVGLAATLQVSVARRRLLPVLAGHERHPIGWACAVALVASAGSLYFSEVVGFQPCLLCWYQRIAMYPLVVVLAVGLVRGEAGVWRYAIPLAALGALVSGLHVWIQWQPSAALQVCGAGPPCTGRYLAVLGFVTIPTMAGSAFLLIVAVLLLVAALERRPSDADSATP